MKDFKRKRNFKRGASVMIALAIFLLCGLAGVSAFVMASSNAGRKSHTEEQAYYTVSSAALMFVEMIDGLKYTSQQVLFDYERSWTFENGNEHNSVDGYTLTIPTANGTISGGSGTFSGSKLGFHEVVREYCDKLVVYKDIPSVWYEQVKENEGAPQRPETAPSATYSFTVTVKDSKGVVDSRFGTVDCKLTMNANYDMHLTFSSGGAYAITVYWPTKETVENPVGKQETEYAGQDGSGHYTEGKTTQHSTLTVSAKWRQEDAVISRGEAIGA